MSIARPPLSLLEDGSWQHVLGSLDDLVAYVEAIDVRDGVYSVLDRDGRVIELEASSDDGPVRARVTDRLDRARLEDQMRRLVADQPTRWGLIDADVDLDTLLRAVWRRTYPSSPFPA